MTVQAVKQNSGCLPQFPALTYPLRHSLPIAELEERNQIFPRESEDIPELGRDIGLSRGQSGLKLRDQFFYHTTVVIAIRFHLNESPFTLQEVEHGWDRATVARD